MKWQSDHFSKAIKLYTLLETTLVLIFGNKFVLLTLNTTKT